MSSATAFRHGENFFPRLLRLFVYVQLKVAVSTSSQDYRKYWSPGVPHHAATHSGIPCKASGSSVMSGTQRRIAMFRGSEGPVREVIVMTNAAGFHSLNVRKINMFKCMRLYMRCEH